MKTVFKYPLDLTGATQVIEMPEEAEVLHVDAQRGRLTLWALVESDWPPKERRFFVRGTGEEVWSAGIDSFEHVGSVVIEPYVWHVFEDTTK